MRILDRVMSLNLRPIASKMLLLVLLAFTNVFVYYIEQGKCFDVSIQQSSLTHFSPLWSSVISPENIRKPRGFQMASGGIKVEHWEVDGLTYVGFFC